MAVGVSAFLQLGPRIRRRAPLASCRESNAIAPGHLARKNIQSLNKRTGLGGLRGGRWIRGIRCIRSGEAGPAETQLGPSTEAAGRATGQLSQRDHATFEPGKIPGY